MNLDILAYSILGVCFIFGVLPIIGDSMLGGVNSYKKSISVGIVFVGVISMVGIIGIAIIWSLHHLGLL